MSTPTTPAAATPTSPPGARTGPVIAVLALGLFMTLLDLTIVNIAIPDLVDSLGSSLDQVLWVLNAYSLLYAVLLITTGRLGDLIGPKAMYLTGMAVFVAASAGSGFARTTAVLIACRALQGVGAAMLAPQTLVFITALLPPDKRAAGFAAIGGTSGLAVLAGPTLGGFIVTHLGWEWIFFVNLPIGLLTMALCVRLVPDVRPGIRHRLDLLGVLLLTAGLFGVVFGLIEGERYDWATITGALTIPEVIAAGVAVLVLFGVREARRQGGEPLLPFEVFRNRNFTLMAGVLAIMGFAMVGLYLPLTIYFQSVLGLSAVAAGLAIAPQPLAMMFSSMLGGALSDRIFGKYLLVPGLVLFGAGSAWVALAAHADSGRLVFVPGLVIAGLGMGWVWVPVFSLATRDLPPRLAGVSSGVLDTVQELGSVLATAVIGALLSSRLASSLHDEAVSRSAGLPDGVRSRFVAGFDQAGSSGLQVGAGSGSGGGTGRLAQLGHDVFAHGFVTAMRPTMLVPVALMALAAFLALAVRRPADVADVAEVVEGRTDAERPMA
ncbi:MFS transporter [Spongisporangium articulatum]|uniref:MFS transporter n=1 Tax=Spongisporangium articulatum TaxID=3362603 RepID=A0ABW8AQB0_9ACTN